MTHHALHPDRLAHLAQRCLAEDQEAWHQLCHTLSPCLADVIRRQLRRYRWRDRYPVEVEDMLQGLWLRLRDDPRDGSGVMRRLLADAAPLLPALAKLARRLTDNAVESARARGRRETIVARPRQLSDREGPLAFALADLLARLSARERLLVGAQLSQGRASAVSPAAERQQLHRLRHHIEKLLAEP